MKIFRHLHIPKFLVLLLLMLMFEPAVSYGRIISAGISSVLKTGSLSSSADSGSEYLGLVHLSNLELFEILIIIIFILLGFILHTFWLHKQRRKLKAMNIVLTEQRAEQEMILEDRMNKQREMSHLNQVQNRILSIVGHDLRGPLASMYEIFRAYSMGEMKMDKEELDVFLKECYQQLGSVYFLAENLLFWAKNQRDGIDAFPGNYSLYNMAEEAISLLEQVASSKNIRVEIDIDKNTRVHCDYNQISSVLRNLVSNSIKFTTQGGRVVVSSRAIKDEQVITVSDNGVGMEQNKLDLMIQQRIAYTTKGTDNESGTGLGISLIAEFVEKNGGKLIGSSRPGHGTSFSFSLPVTDWDNDETEDNSVS